MLKVAPPLRFSFHFFEPVWWGVAHKAICGTCWHLLSSCIHFVMPKQCIVPVVLLHKCTRKNSVDFVLLMWHLYICFVFLIFSRRPRYYYSCFPFSAALNVVKCFLVIYSAARTFVSIHSMSSPRQRGSSSVHHTKLTGKLCDTSTAFK